MEIGSPQNISKPPGAGPQNPGRQQVSGNNVSFSGTLPHFEPAVSGRSNDAYNGPQRSGFQAHISAYGSLTAVYRREKKGGAGARVSEDTYQLAQVDDLCKALGEQVCSLEPGRISLERSLLRPPVSSDLVRTRQGAVRELLEGGTARDVIDSIIQKSASDLSTVLRFIFPPWGEMISSRDFKETGRALERLGKLGAESVPFKSELLNSTVASLEGFSKSDVLRYFKEGICELGRGVALCADAPLLNRVLYRYVPGAAGPKTLAALSLGGLAMTAGVFAQVASLEVLGPATLTSLIPFLSHKHRYDEHYFFRPIGELLSLDQQFGRALTALGLLDELRGLARISDEYREGGVLPEIVESPRHVLHVKDGHNPLLALGNGLSVANDFVFDNGVIKGLTGPNSGGKSTYARTAIQLQILGQIGAPLPAQYARLSVADEMLYQAQSFNELSDAEGRFGEELKVTKGLFERATPKTFAVFDELAQGTTHEESRHVASYIIRGLSKLGINGVLITHDHELVESLSGEQVVEPVQAELRNDIPTHRIVGGISRKSHAERVAKKIGLGPEDVENFVMAARERHEIVMRETVQNKVSGLQD